MPLNTSHWSSSPGGEADPAERKPPLAITRTQRRLGIDALRGLAVLFMLGQHIGYWVTGLPRSHPLSLAVDGLGGLAAPVFVMLAGLGATFTAVRHDACDALLVRRGAMVVAFGYLINVLTPHWFAPSGWYVSWYVLHLIGAALMVAPLLRRLGTPALLGVMAAIIVATALIQYGLDTPFRLSNRQMAYPLKPWWFLRFMLAEGFFPLFPWMAFFVSGMIAGRWLIGGRSGRVLQLALVLLVVSGLLSACYYFKLDFVRSDLLVRYFKPKATFYPAMTPITLFLMAVALGFLALFTALDNRAVFKSADFLVNLGRCSLTVIIVHIPGVRESAVFLGYWKTLGVTGTATVLAAAMFLFSLAAVWWRKIDFKYGAEWVLRKVAG